MLRELSRPPLDSVWARTDSACRPLVSRRFTHYLLVGLAAASLPACWAGPTNVPSNDCNSGASFASKRMILLSDAQYVNVVRDVFDAHLEPDVTSDHPPDGQHRTNDHLVVIAPRALAYFRAADEVARQIRPCGDAPVDRSCMEAYLRQKLPRAFRRPVMETEISDLLDLFTLGMQDNPIRAVELTMEAALSSPSFLYRQELGTNLDSYELASAISFALLDSAPDPELWPCAVDGSLTEPEILRQQIRRLLETTTVRQNLKKKVSYYLNFEKTLFVVKDRAKYPEFTTSLQRSIYESSQLWLDDVLWSGRFSDLLRSRRIYANEEMARVYELGELTGSELVPIETRGDAFNAGILTHPALLLTTNEHAGTDDIIHRGLWVYDHLACGTTLGAPPVDANQIAATFTGTEREKVLQRNQTSCGACHRSFDPFGLVTQNYDPIGRFRTQDDIDTSAVIEGLGSDLDGHVADARDVADKFLLHSRASDCAAIRISTLLLEHNPEVERSCELSEVTRSFHESGSFLELFTSIFTSPAFQTRDEAPQP
jgi:hypothetical protein